jgi:SNF2 family DNA or RNA helicase
MSKNDNNSIIDYTDTDFFNGLSVEYNKALLTMEVLLEMHEENLGGSLEIFIGLENLYSVNKIEAFLNALNSKRDFSLNKNFTIEPKKMYFDKLEIRILEFLTKLIYRRKSNPSFQTSEVFEFNTNKIHLSEVEFSMFLDIIWDENGDVKFHKKSKKYKFLEDIDIKIFVEKVYAAYLMKMDYSAFGDFVPVSLDFKYIFFRNKNFVVRLPQSKRELFENLFKYKNDSNIVVFKIHENEKKQFQKSFIKKFEKLIKISVDASIQKEAQEESIISNIYFDVSQKGIVVKTEFCYGMTIINPLDDSKMDKSFREFDEEEKVLDELKILGFKDYKKLYLLDDVEMIMFLLTDKLINLKKIAQLYYSEDFKKLHVKNLNGLGLSLSEDGSVIHMNINIENVSDEELKELLESINKGKKYYRLKNGSIINLNSVESSKLADLLKGLDINKDSVNGGIFEIPLNRCLYIDNYLKDKGIENVKMDFKLGYLMKNFSIQEDSELYLKPELDSILRNYQKVGVKWLKTMAKYGFGGILADDMGLGKTIQVLSFISCEAERKLPCIVVAPTSIIYNWKIEAERFTPELKVLLVNGLKERRKLLILSCNNFDLVITSYGALKNDIEEYKKFCFSYIFIDEAQNIKNPMTINANSVKSLKGKSCFALTGTPIENSLSELWSIFDFIMPGYLFDRKKFVADFEEPIVREKNTDKSNQLLGLIKPFILRRIKREVLTELPEKIEINYVTEMTFEQKKLYAAYYKELKNELLTQIEENKIEKNRIEILSALTRLRQICAHPSTFLDNYIGGSCKLDLAIEIITEAIESGHSVLLFSQFTKMLKIIREELGKNSINYYYLDGKMTPEERIVEIDNFNSDKETVFLISLKAGGTGLNLTKADVIIHFDPWWNPAVEDQASDRAHRFGQKNVVQVYKLLAEGTIEEKIIQLQERKRDLIGNIIKSGENFINQLSENEIKELFGT